MRRTSSTIRRHRTGMTSVPHDHVAENEEVVEMNVIVAWAEINGERVPINGYVIRCRICGEVYPVPVG